MLLCRRTWDLPVRSALPAHRDWSAARQRRCCVVEAIRARSYRQHVDVPDLEALAAVLALEDPRLAPGGPMACYLGEQLTEAEVVGAFGQHWGGLIELPALVLRSIRCFPVVPLRGVRLTCRPDEFSRRIRRTFQKCLPGITWPSFGDRGTRGLVGKYMLLDVSYQAPSDPVSGQDMVIELGGRILAQDGSPIPPGGRFPELVTVTVEQAHWVNVSGLKVGVPFYM